MPIITIDLNTFTRIPGGPPFHPETSDAVHRQLARSARRLNFDERAGESVPAAATGMSAATAGSANRT
ncbi:MAG TPA: hypothetical protein VIK97_10335, partial [Casimicrobiaceae bacterium]